MKFISRYKGLNVVLIPARYISTPYGERQYVAGKHAQFVNAMFETKDQEIIDLLKKSRSYGIDFWSAEPNETVLISKEAEERVVEEKVIEETTELNCPICGRRVVNKVGLRSHMRTHES